MHKQIRYKLIGLVLFMVVFAVDFGLKKLMTGVDLQLIGDFFELKYAENTGIAFSLPIPPGVSSVFSVLLLGVGSYLAGRYLKWDRLVTPIIFGLVIGGALGNLFDRLFYGYVIDYVSIWIWPIFNFADAAIFVAAILLIVFYDKITIVKHKK